MVLNLGQAVKLANSHGDTWGLGVKFFLAGNRILCELIDNVDNPPSKDSVDLKLMIPYDNGIYAVPVIITSIDLTTLEYKFSLAKEYEIVQRRDYYRLPDPLISVDCDFLGRSLKQVKVLDISGGGIGLVVDRAIKDGTAIQLQVTLPEGTTMQITARAAHVSKNGDGDGYKVGAMFVKIDRADRAKIIRYAYNEQVLKEKSQSNIESINFF